MAGWDRDETRLQPLGDYVREHMPLAVGSKWEYRDAVSGEIASVRVTGIVAPPEEPTADIRVGEYHLEARGDMTDGPDGPTWYEVDFGILAMRAEMSHGPGTGVFVRFPDEEPSLARPWLQFHEGQAWDVWVDEDADKPTMRFERVDYLDVVDAAAGVCEPRMVVRMATADGAVDHLHFSPGIGIARLTRETQRDGDTRLERDWMLTSYAPAE